MVILGTQYAGEMKKGVFSIMHYLMPKQGILSLHSGCNEGRQGDVSLFFGLSGEPGAGQHLTLWTLHHYGADSKKRQQSSVASWLWYGMCSVSCKLVQSLLVVLLHNPSAVWVYRYCQSRVRQQNHQHHTGCCRHWQDHAVDRPSEAADRGRRALLE